MEQRIAMINNAFTITSKLTCTLFSWCITDNVCSITESGVSRFFTDCDDKITPLCYYSELSATRALALSQETKAVLQHRVNPSLLEVQACAVECLLYLPGSE